MAYVVTDACVKCKYADCVDVCPVDCFREGPNMLVINPDECIGARSASPNVRSRRFFPDDVPETMQDYIALNAEMAQIWPPIVEKKDPLADHEKWASSGR